MPSGAGSVRIYRANWEGRGEGGKDGGTLTFLLELEETKDPFYALREPAY